MSKRSKVSLTRTVQEAVRVNVVSSLITFASTTFNKDLAAQTFYYSFQVNGLFTLPVTDSDADPCTDIRPKNGYSNDQDPDLDWPHPCNGNSFYVVQFSHQVWSLNPCPCPAV